MEPWPRRFGAWATPLLVVLALAGCGRAGVCVCGGGAPCIDGRPKTWFGRVMTGLLERESARNASCSDRVGVLGVCERELSGRGVPERDLSKRWDWVSTRRIEGGCWMRRT